MVQTNHYTSAAKKNKNIVAKGLYQLNITFVISSLAVGGAERVISLMANYWVESGKKVDIITFDKCHNDFFPLSPLVCRKSIDALKSSKSIIEALQINYLRIINLRSEIIKSQPDIVISFMDKTNILTLISCMGLKIPVIVSERTHPKYYFIGIFWELLRRIFYPLADAIVVQTETVKAWVNSFLQQKNIFIIPNPVIEDANSCAGNSDLLINEHTIMAVGRLSYEKGFDLLLHAFSKCSKKFPDWNLVILGEGSYRGCLEALIIKLALTKSVSLPGKRNNPQSLFKQCGLFVLSSRFEGFPNVLLEAMSCGLSVVSFNCPSGPSDIIVDNHNGILVPLENVDALAGSMMHLMSNKDKRKELGKNAREVINTLHIDKIMKQWDELIYSFKKSDE